MILSHWRPYWTVTDDLLWIESALFDHERRRNKIESAFYAVAYIYTRCIEAMFDWTCLYDFTVITFYWCDAITILLLVHTFNIQKKLYNFLCMNNCIYVSIVKKHSFIILPSLLLSRLLELSAYYGSLAVRNVII